MKILLLIFAYSFFTFEVGSKSIDISEYRTITIDNNIDLIKDVASHYKQDYELIKYIFDVSGQFDLDPLLLISLIQIESHFRANAISESYAVGYTQIKPIVIKDIGVDLDRFNPQENIMIGAIFLSKLINIYDNDIREALVHYNAGTVEEFEMKGNIYAKNVLSEYNKISVLREKYS